MNKRQKKKKSKKYIIKMKKFFKKQGIKLRDKNTTTGSRFEVKQVIVYQSLEQLRNSYPNNE